MRLPKESTLSSRTQCRLCYGSMLPSETSGCTLDFMHKSFHTYMFAAKKLLRKMRAVKITLHLGSYGALSPKAAA